MRKISRLEVIETGARRRWTPAKKQRIVAESLMTPPVLARGWLGVT
jgi:transposase-like protein